MIKNWNIDCLDKEIGYEWELVSINEDSRGVMMILQNTKSSNEQFLNIKFKDVVSYKRTFESNRLNTLDKYKDFFSENKSPFFLIDNSEYKKWQDVESCGIHSEDELLHYAIYTADDFVDILSYEQPEALIRIKNIH